MTDNISYLKSEYRQEKGESAKHGGGNPPGGEGLEARVAKLETHVEYIRRDLDSMSDDLKEMKDDLGSIKRRMAYFSGAGLIVLAVAGWILNNRFDQIITMLTTVSK